MRMTVAQARSDFAEIINQVAYGKQRVIITRRGKKVAALVPIDELEMLEAFNETIIIDQAKVAWEEAKEKGTIPLEEVKRKLGL